MAAQNTTAGRQSRAPVLATVFFDGGCPLCRREIDHYRSLRGAERVAWVDITQRTDTLAAHGLRHDAAMARLHVRDTGGTWHTGARGFAELWSHLRGYRWLARLLRAAGLLPLLDWAYTHFARWRLQRRCADAACNTAAAAESRQSGHGNSASHRAGGNPPPAE